MDNLTSVKKYLHDKYKEDTVSDKTEESESISDPSSSVLDWTTTTTETDTMEESHVSSSNDRKGDELFASSKAGFHLEEGASEDFDEKDLIWKLSLTSTSRSDRRKTGPEFSKESNFDEKDLSWNFPRTSTPRSDRRKTGPESSFDEKDLSWNFPITSTPRRDRKETGPESDFDEKDLSWNFPLTSTPRSDRKETGPESGSVQEEFPDLDTEGIIVPGISPRIFDKKQEYDSAEEKQLAVKFLVEMLENDANSKSEGYAVPQPCEKIKSAEVPEGSSADIPDVEA